MRSPDPAVVDLRRTDERLDALRRIAAGPAGGADRPAFSQAEAEAMHMVANWAADSGLEPSLDVHGNLWALPRSRSGPLVTSGSHVDTVPDGGRLDGALGTVLALEAARAAGEDGAPRCGLLVCCAEEAPRFGAGTIGSRLLAGTLRDDELGELRDPDGTTALAARSAYLDALSDLPRIDEPPLAGLAAHVEVHVEQRHELRRRGARIGVVERIAAPCRQELLIEGDPGHAGELAMSDRRDALCAAAELVLALERGARELGPETVATTGRLSVEPGAVSVVPGLARLGLEIRSTDGAEIAGLDALLADACDRVEAERGVSIARRTLRTGVPVTLDPELAATVVALAERLGVTAQRTWSGAGHDVQHLAALVPAALLFVPLAGGASHTPVEHAEPDDVALAGRLLSGVIDAVRQRA